MSKELVRLWQRPSKDGRSFKYYLIFTDHDGKRKQKSLGHANKRKAQIQRAELEKDLQLGNSTPNSMRLSEMLTDYLHRTRKQIEPSTAKSAEYRMKDFIAAVGDISAEKITYQYCEKLVHFCIDKGLSPASINTHIKMLKRIFSLAVKRGQLEKNPFGGFPLMRVARKNVRVLTDNETQRLLRVLTRQ